CFRKRFRLRIKREHGWPQGRSRTAPATVTAELSSTMPLAARPGRRKEATTRKSGDLPFPVTHAGPRGVGQARSSVVVTRKSCCRAPERPQGGAFRLSSLSPQPARG